MNDEQVRELLLRQWTFTGGPNEAKAAEDYHEDALLQFPRSGERFRGRANIQGWRQQYPARLDFEPRRIRGRRPLGRRGRAPLRRRRPGQRGVASAFGRPSTDSVRQVRRSGQLRWTRTRAAEVRTRTR
jgi:hypothetical protein